MKIYVDADACPVRKEIIQTARHFRIPVYMVTDTNHMLEETYANVVTVDQGPDSVDFYIMKQIQPEDLLITQDYGLAAMALSRNAHAVNLTGQPFRQEGMDQLLFERHLARENRKKHRNRLARHKKRTAQDGLLFQKRLEEVLTHLLEYKQV